MLNIWFIFLLCSTISFQIWPDWQEIHIMVWRFRLLIPATSQNKTNNFIDATAEIQLIDTKTIETFTYHQFTSLQSSTVLSRYKPYMSSWLREQVLEMLSDLGI